ncbi:hypothetical protein PVL29_026315 [Vitis rotundifolia]|uniref:Uncharacterized protein n=1 Tax=Vitis rotundifolia TaxID=103349 RepID=A0AA38YMA9_VITRO|nr:hypothetical protein PVL29_026315 [Vitis rotundifolia]
MGPFNDVKYHNLIKESIKKDTPIPIWNSLGPLGTTLQIMNFYSFYHLITHNHILVTKYFQLDNSKQTFQTLIYYLMDENRITYNPNPCSNIILNPFNLNWYFLHHNYCEEASTIISLGYFICENILLEVRSIDSISINLQKRVKGWNEHITRILGIPWGFFIGAELTIAQSCISLVNKIQKVYRSQGV